MELAPGPPAAPRPHSPMRAPGEPTNYPSASVSHPRKGRAPPASLGAGLGVLPAEAAQRAGRPGSRAPGEGACLPRPPRPRHARAGTGTSNSRDFPAAGAGSERWPRGLSAPTFSFARSTAALGAGPQR